MNRPGFAGDPGVREDGVTNRSTRYAPEVRERADIMSISKKIGCTAETLHR
jgi:hypothetical protein